MKHRIVSLFSKIDDVLLSRQCTCSPPKANWTLEGKSTAGLKVKPWQVFEQPGRYLPSVFTLSALCFHAVPGTYQAVCFVSLHSRLGTCPRVTSPLPPETRSRVRQEVPCSGLVNSSTVSLLPGNTRQNCPPEGCVPLPQHMYHIVHTYK